MEQVTFQQILEQINVLAPDQLHQVSRMVQERLAPGEKVRKRRAFHQALLASGLVKRIKTHSPTDGAERRLVQVQGPPVSQTIIEERR